MQTGLIRFFFVLSFISISWLVQPVCIAEPIPACRYDNNLVPIVKQAIDWTIDDFKSKGISLPFERVTYNKPSIKDNKTLTIHIVKDATLNTVDRSGCILNKSFLVNGSKVSADGDCIPTDRSKCTLADKAYMQRRFIDIHSKFSDVQTGYELTGACYMTNLQACLHRDRFEFLKLLGQRDMFSIKGSCVTNARSPMSIHCSAGALKMLLSREAAKELAPTVSILFVLAHEIGHLSENISSSYDTADYTVKGSWPRSDKFTVIRNQCQLGSSLRGREAAADELALMVTQQHLSEINKRWPKQGTISWLITQAGHYSTNLVRWNNDWRDGEFADIPDEFQAPRGVTILNDKDMAYMDSEEVPSGFTKLEIRMRSKLFLCRLAQKSSGESMILIQSGTTHGTMTERVSWVLGKLRKSLSDEDRESSGTESLTGRIGNMTMRRHRSYLRELEAEICDLLDQDMQCPGDMPK